jgi:hypothetical protein
MDEPEIDRNNLNLISAEQAWHYGILPKTDSAERKTFYCLSFFNHPHQLGLQNHHPTSGHEHSPLPAFQYPELIHGPAAGQVVMPAL